MNETQIDFELEVVRDGSEHKLDKMPRVELQ